MSPNNDIFSDIISKMTEIALADGRITEEEQELLASAQVNLLMYDEALAKALEDGIIDQNELELLEGFKEQIIQDAILVSEISEGISEDELKILDALIHLVRGSSPDTE